MVCKSRGDRSVFNAHGGKRLTRDSGSTFWDAFSLRRDHYAYGSGGAGLSVPRSRLKTDAGNHEGIASSLATRKPITSISDAIVRGPLQSQSGRTTSVGW